MSYFSKKFMSKNIYTVLLSILLFFMVPAFAAVEVNQATVQQLEAIDGIGPVMAKAIIEARAKGEFKSWGDFQKRVKGVGAKRAESFSKSGLTVKSQPFTGKTSTLKDKAAQPAVANKPMGDKAAPAQPAKP